MSRNNHRNGGRMHGPVAMAGDKPKNFKGSAKRLLSWLKPYRAGLITAMIFAVVTTLCSVFAPKVLGLITTELYEGTMRMLAGTGGINMKYIFAVMVVLAALYLGSVCFQYFTQFIMARVSQRTMYDMRKAIQAKLTRLPLNYFDTRAYGDILSRVTNDVDTVSSGLQQSITQIITSVVTVVGIVVMMLSINPLMTLLALLILPITLVLTMTIVKKSQKYFVGNQRALGDLNGHIEEMYTGFNIVKLFSMEKKAAQEFSQVNGELYNYNWKSQFAAGLMMPVVGFVGNLGYVAVAVVGGMLAVSGSLAVGDIQAFIQYVRQFNQPISQTANIANIMQSCIAAAERVFELLDETEEPAESENPVKLEDVRGEVSFENVVFGYNPENPLITGLNLNIKSGQKVAIVGPTGAGKTTLINLLMRFYDVNSGAVKIDGVDIRDMRRDDLRDIFGMVLQDTWLFYGSIKENIRYGDMQSSDDEVVRSAKLACAHHFIKTLPDGYNMMLNEEASNISQGQKQLVTIARAIISDPKILILDEATSSVDTRTEVLIQKAMVNLMKDRTSFIIAHRLSTIRDADVILVMNKGDIVEAGTHEELMAKKGFYENLYNSQFAEKQAV